MNQFSKGDAQLLKNYASKKDIKGMKSIINKNKPTDRTLIVRYSRARQLLKHFTDDVKLLDQLVAPREITTKIIKENENKRDDSERVGVTKSFLNKILSYAKSTNIYEVALYLLLLTGRRTGELINAKFYVKKGQEDIYIDGVLKRSDGGNNCHFPPLRSKNKTIYKLRQFKKLYKELGLKEASFRRELLRQVKSKLGDEVHPHMLRGIYANYLYKFRNKEDNQKINTFIMDKLCHESIGTSLNYTGYELMFDDDFIK